MRHFCFVRVTIPALGIMEREMATREGQRLVKAASRGDTTAQLDLGRLYLEGGEGLGANPTVALNWLTRAWKGGRAEAAREIAEHIPPH